MWTRFGVILLALTALGACDRLSYATAGERGDALWSEFLPDAVVKEELKWLAREHADLYLAIPEARIGDPSLAKLIVEARKAGIGVRAWLLLDEVDGYWPNEHNVPQTREAALRLLAWRDAHDLPFDWIVLDLEMSIERTRTITELVRTQGATAAIEAIKAGRNPDAFVANRAALVDLVDELRGKDIKVAAVTYPLVLDDLADGDDQIQDALDAPVFGPAWDEVSFMVYQSLMYDLSGSWHGPDLVFSYAASAHETFGGDAGIALGVVGTAGITPVRMPYPNAATLVADRGAARAAGVDRVSVYSLDGLRQMPPAEREAWMVPGTEAPPEPFDAEGVRATVRALLD